MSFLYQVFHVGCKLLMLAADLKHPDIIQTIIHQLLVEASNYMHIKLATMQLYQQTPATTT